MIYRDGETPASDDLQSDELTELDRQELYENGDLSERQKVYLGHALDFTEKLGLALWFDAGTPCVFLTKDEEICSDVLSIDEDNLRALSNLVMMLEFMCAYVSAPTVDDRLNDIERRLQKLEQQAELGQPSVQTDPLLADALRTPQASGELSEAERESFFKQLVRRAEVMGHALYKNHENTYRYLRRKRGPIHSLHFTIQDAFDSRHRRENGRWCFDYDELDVLEKFIIHDEEIYAKYFAGRRL